MSRLWIASTIVLLCVALPAMAQQPAPSGPAAPGAAIAPERALPAPPPARSPDAPSRQGGQTDNRMVQPSLTASSGTVEPTPEMWLYEQQLREYLDPGMAVRRNAEFRSAQRRHRMASLKWFGFSNQRPGVSPDPYNGEYAPAWVGNSGLYPYRWSGGNTGPWLVLRPGTTAY